ncbi:tight adherence protein B [Salana multivorans]|uniref:Tight adherence protein B n=1 Tax=Salana multivorans TaxID=120377 RepID=A0A3N2D8T4_9MICO|nr:tight adherence protein B [Salana multivorans]
MAVEPVRVRSADPGVDGVAPVSSERAGAWRVRTTVPAEGLPPELLALVGRSPGADAAYVATRVALRSGAPLADVLDAVAVAVAEAEAAEADRRRARAGPASTARLLGWLPLGALLLGTGFGADPVAVVLAGGPGLLAMVAGGLLMVAGRWWSARLVRAATVDDGGPATRARG